MHEPFDDIIRRQLEGLESPVPLDMFDAICRQPDMQDATFDAGLKNKLAPAESSLPLSLFDKIAASTDLTNAPFDGFMRQQLTAHQSPVPVDMWRRIQHKKDHRRPVAWWWVAAGLALLFSGGTWYALQHSHDQKAVLGEKIPAGQKAEQNALPAQLADGVTVKKPVVPAADSLIIRIPSNQTPVSPNKKDFTIAPDPDHQSTANLKVNKPVIPENSDKKASGNLFSGNSQLKKAATPTAVYSNKNGSSFSNDPATILNSHRNVDDIADDNATLRTGNQTITQQLRNAAKLSPGQLLKARPRLPIIPCPTDVYSRSNNWYVDVYSSAFLVGKNISDKTAGKNAKTGFDSTLHRQVSFNAGMSLVKNIGKNVFLKTGAQYNQVNETFRLTRINERKLVTIVSVRTVIIAPGDTIRIRDTSVTELIGTVQRRTQNKLKQWDVPLIIGYEFGGEGIRLNANAGIIANIRSSYTGDMIADTTRQIINVTAYNGQPVYKTNVGISLYAGLSIIKPLGERTSLLIEPYARMGLKNIAAEQAWFRQKNSAAGITVGLRYQLNISRQRR